MSSGGEADRSTVWHPITRDSGHMNATTSTVKTYPAYFTAAGADTFEPTPSAAGYWGDGLLSGPAVAGLAARTLEDRYGDPQFQPARFTIDLLVLARRVAEGHIGLASLIVGIEAIGGAVDIDTAPGSGTSVTVSMTDEPARTPPPLEGGTALIPPIPARG